MHCDNFVCMRTSINQWLLHPWRIINESCPVRRVCVQGKNSTRTTRSISNDIYHYMDPSEEQWKQWHKWTIAFDSLQHIPSTCCLWFWTRPIGPRFWRFFVYQMKRKNLLKMKRRFPLLFSEKTMIGSSPKISRVLVINESSSKKEMHKHNCTI